MDPTSKTEPLPRDRFHSELRTWFRTSEAGDTIGDLENYGGKAWVWIKHLGNRYYLNADTTYEGVAGYLDILEALGETIRWSVVENQRGNANKAAFGPDRLTVSGFYLYRA